MSVSKTYEAIVKAMLGPVFRINVLVRELGLGLDLKFD